MDAGFSAEEAVARVGAAIGEVSRARILYALMDGRARTSTELSLVANVSPSTASAHLSRLAEAGLVQVLPQGRRRYFSLADEQVAGALERLLVLATGSTARVGTRTPVALRQARTCYDHLAGRLAVSLLQAVSDRDWLRSAAHGAYALSDSGAQGFGGLGLALEPLRQRRRRFACACVDWSERRPHLAGALGAALLQLLLARGWLLHESDGRQLIVTDKGVREFRRWFGVEAVAGPH